MAAHQPFRQLAVALGDGVGDEFMLLDGVANPITLHPELAAVHPRQVIKIIAEDVDQPMVAATLIYPEV